MGGIAGIVHFSGPPPEEAALSRMLDALAHRGSDGIGRFAEGGALIGQRRSDVGDGPQAQPTVTGEHAVVLDGRLFDPDALALSAGVHLRGAGSGAAIAAAFRAFQAQFAERLHGAFALAVWEREARALHLVRDRMGSRPLYWARSGGRFAFASELRALTTLPWVSTEIARENLSEYLSFRVVHAPRTLLRDVQQVEPARGMRVDADQITIRRYWVPLYAPKGTKRPRAADVVPLLQEAVDAGVKRRLLPGVETGLYLSGGIGSTAIAAAARRLSVALPTFTISFSEDSSPETPFAGRVARLMGFEHHEIAVGSAELAATFEDGVKALGHPLGNPAAFLQMRLAKAASERVSAVLSGDGGEELFGGRMLDGPSRWLSVAERVAALPWPAKSALTTALSQTARGRRLTTPPEKFGLSLGIGGSDLFSTQERVRLLSDPLLVRAEVRRDVLAPIYADLDTDPLNAILHAFGRSWLSDESLVRADRSAANAGISVYFPLLDRDVLALAARLPGSFKVRRTGGGLHTRWPLQAMLSGIVPPPLVNRPKRGLPTPLDAWLSGPGRLFLEARFALLREDPDRLWQRDALDALKRDVGKTEGTGIRLWSLFILDAWRRGLRG